MKGKALLIFGLILLALVPAYYVNKWLQALVKPRTSFLRLMLYMLLTFGLIFVYTFLIVSIILKLFPLPKG